MQGTSWRMWRETLKIQKAGEFLWSADTHHLAEFQAGLSAVCADASRLLAHIQANSQLSEIAVRLMQLSPYITL